MLLFDSEITFREISVGRAESEMQGIVPFKSTCCFSYFCLFFYFFPRRMPYNTQLPFSQLSLGKENNVAHSMYHLQQG